jgi:hypothetical protein
MTPLAAGRIPDAPPPVLPGWRRIIPSGETALLGGPTSSRAGLCPFFTLAIKRMFDTDERS